jgi:hypothetical protein
MIRPTAVIAAHRDFDFFDKEPTPTPLKLTYSAKAQTA